ncbi:MAG: sugar phosphate nucleotidyltransferase [Solirubrobacteraceae bacterium]
MEPTGSLPPVVILCGGRGTRLQEHTREIPKPLVEIGGRPILWHVIGLYAAQGFERFLLATGYKGELIERFVKEMRWPRSISRPRSISVETIPTGLATPTGGRIARLRDRLGDERFCATYADGLADIDLEALLAAHVASACGGRGDPIATVTVVRPELQFGVARLEQNGERVLGFEEKPRSEHWVNGGFLCFEPGVFDYLREDSVLERDALGAIAGDGRLRAHRHEGFWECMDTYKDAVALNDLWSSGEPPWRPWQGTLARPVGGAGARR